MKKAIKLFMNIAELCYDLEYSPLSEMVASVENDVKEAEELHDITKHLDEIEVLLNEIDDEDDSETSDEILKIKDLINKLQELD